MPIPNIEQPDIIEIDSTLRLRAFDGIFDFALPWYCDTEVVYLVDGVKKAYSPEKLERMYRYLDTQGELYFIEALENGRFVPIGDVTFWEYDMPIVIGDARYRGRHVGRRVVEALTERARQIGYDKIYVNEIYSYNEGSRRCFEAAGFKVYKSDDAGVSLMLEL